MFKRLLKAPQRYNSSFFLFGPRGTGKSFWTQAEFPNALVFDLLSMETYLEFLQNPSALETKIPPGFQNWILIDEIQKIPDLLNEVHRLIELHSYKFIIWTRENSALQGRDESCLAGLVFRSLLTFNILPNHRNGRPSTGPSKIARRP